jgi:hypothetical protein
MTKYFKAKFEDDSKVKKILATDVKEEYGKLIVYYGEKIVGEFPISKVEYWSFESECDASSLLSPG